ncbi:G5 domain-containing protein [Anaerobacillus sp. HL2]|nr:G5 domain-containing protein [Anaerobacillus sp. HL2]
MTIYVPIIKVIVEEATKVKEEIPFQTETKDDEKMWKGDTKVQQAGQAGERIVVIVLPEKRANDSKANCK